MIFSFPTHLIIRYYLLLSSGCWFSARQTAGMTLSKWVWWAGATLAFLLITEVNNIFGSVGDVDFLGLPDPDPLVGQRCGSGSGSFPFLIKVLGGLK
jgi:hypothetical protein